jgi:G3E family GTPase
MTAVPIVLVGGGLGAGKTSLLRTLMASPQLPRLGLVVNEFGELDVDGALLAQSGSPVVTLPNGCVCCAAGGDLAAAVGRLLRGPGPFDALVVELSGVADPYPVLQELRLLGAAVRLANVIAVVDLDRPTSAAVGDPVLLRLLSIADTIVLNKRDLATADRLAAWRDLAGASNPRAQVHVAEHGGLPLAVVLDAQHTERPRGASGQAAHAAFHTKTVMVPAGLSRARLQAALAPPFDIERVKGFVCLAEGPFLVQVVRGHATFEPLDRSPPQAALNKLVLISSDAARLQAQAAALW